MTELFSDGKKLIDIIEKNNWQLYDITPVCKEEISEIVGWLEYKEPANRIIKGSSYLFAPTPEEDETIGEAYSFRGGFGPALVISDVNDKRMTDVKLYDKVVFGSFGEKDIPCHIALISKLFFLNGYLITTNHVEGDPLESDLIIMPQDRSVEIFRDYFRIINFDDYGLDEYRLIPHTPLN